MGGRRRAAAAQARGRGLKLSSCFREASTLRRTCISACWAELARDALEAAGWDVLGAYLSPVNENYGKKGLVSGAHRVRMCQLATEDSSFIMVDAWEASQDEHQRTLHVLQRIERILNSTVAEASSTQDSGAAVALTGPQADDSHTTKERSLGAHTTSPAGGFFTQASSAQGHGGTQAGDSLTRNDPHGGLQSVPAQGGPLPAPIRVVLVCGADLLKSFTVPGVWVPHQVGLTRSISCLLLNPGCAWCLVFLSSIR